MSRGDSWILPAVVITGALVLASGAAAGKFGSDAAPATLYPKKGERWAFEFSLSRALSVAEADAVTRAAPSMGLVRFMYLRETPNAPPSVAFERTYAEDPAPLSIGRSASVAGLPGGTVTETLIRAVRVT